MAKLQEIFDWNLKHCELYPKDQVCKHFQTSEKRGLIELSIISSVFLAVLMRIRIIVYLYKLSFI